MNNILITGGAGFIGSHLTKYFVKKYPDYKIFNLDCLTYAGNLHNLLEIDVYPNYRFLKEDICNQKLIEEFFKEYNISHVIHLAAESHVDRSISDPFSFARTNILGTLSLLHSANNAWKEDFQGKLFYHISTDEVYGSLGKEGLFSEESNYLPNSPYSASKASSDHFVRAFGSTYKLPYIISNCSNNYGPFQFPEKLIPLFINNIINNLTLPVYGDGNNIRDWLYVEDHISAIDQIFHNGNIFETYNIGGNNEWKNIDLINNLIKITDELLGREEGHSNNLIRYVKDRAGHDFRYAIDSSKLQKELGWQPKYKLKDGLKKTVKWYLENKKWIEAINDGSYRDLC